MITNSIDEMLQMQLKIEKEKHPEKSEEELETYILENLKHDCGDVFLKKSDSCNCPHACTKKTFYNHNEAVCTKYWRSE